MFAFSPEHPFLNLSLTIAIGLACTVATGVAVSYGIQYIIRDHNAAALRKEFKRHQRKFKDAIKRVEVEVELAEMELMGLKLEVGTESVQGKLVKGVVESVE
ncbi:hypothetical protein HK097_004890, partial [Rhizophlyctis rosea]